MRTPAGKECPHYYEDFHRGRHVQECRLIKGNHELAPWQPKDCARCPVPEILRANASPSMRLKLTIKPGFLGIGRQLKVEAWCDIHEIPIKNPYVGCPLCAEDNQRLKIFKDALDKSDD